MKTTTKRRPTRAKVEAFVSTLDTEGLTVEVTSDTVLFWYDSCSEAQTEKALAGCRAVCDFSGAGVTSGNGSHYRVNFRKDPAPMDDWNSKASRCHY